MKKEWRRHKIGELLTIALLKDVEKKKIHYILHYYMDDNIPAFRYHKVILTNGF